MRRCLAGCVVALAVWWLSAFAEEPKSNKLLSPLAAKSLFEVSVAAQFAERKDSDDLLATLNKPVRAEFVETPLADVIVWLRDGLQVRLRLDDDGLKNAGIPADSPVTLVTRKERSLSHVLSRIVIPFGLTWEIHRGEILVTAEPDKQIGSMHETRVYNVDAVLRRMAAREVARERRDQDVQQPQARTFLPLNRNSDLPSQQLAQVLPRAFFGHWRNPDGEGGQLTLVGEQVGVRHTVRVHSRVPLALAAMERVLAAESGTSPPVEVGTPSELAERNRLRKKLRQTMSIRELKRPLSEAVEYFAELLDEEVYWLSERGFGGPKGDVEVSLPEGDYVVATALRRMLSNVGLDYLIHDGGIVFATPDKVRDLAPVMVYDIGVVSRDSSHRKALTTALQGIIAGLARNEESTNGDGLFTEFPGGLLVVRQTDAVQDRLALLLHDLRQVEAAVAQEPPRVRDDELETRFHRAKSPAEAESWKRLILAFAAPHTWGEDRVVRTAADRLVIRQTKAVHEQIDQFLRDFAAAAPVNAPTQETSR